MSIEKIKDVFFDERDPKNDVSRIEVSLPDEDIDNFLSVYAAGKFIIDDIEGNTDQADRRRRERLVRKIFKAAALALSDSQFQVFVMRYVFGFKEVEIAVQLGCGQSYISQVLKDTHREVRKLLRLEKSPK